MMSPSNENLKDVKYAVLLYVAVAFLYVFYFPALCGWGEYREWSVLLEENGSLTDYAQYTIALGVLLLTVGTTALLGLITPRVGKKNDRTTQEPRNAILSALLAAGLALITYTWLTGIDSFQGAFNRANRDEIATIGQQLWVVNLLVVQIVVCISLYWWTKTTFVVKVMTMAAVTGVAVTDFILLGGRRGILPVIIFVLFDRRIIQTSISSVKSISIILGAAMAFFLFGGFRELVFHGHERYANATTLLSITKDSNEFQETGYGIYNATQFAKGNGLKLGETYVESPYIFVPRAFWQEKPVSLTYRLGAMISPFAEAYVNFAINGVVVIAVGIFIMIQILRLGRRSFWACLAVALCFDQMRTGLAEVLYVTAIVLVVTKLSTRQSKVRSDPGSTAAVPTRGPRLRLTSRVGDWGSKGA